MKDFLSKITLGAAFKKAKKYFNEHGGGAGFEVVIGWKAGTEPDVTKIPAGVTVEYQGVTYTGTLAASASTKGQIVLIAIPDSTQPNIYSEYTTHKDGNVYAWEMIGTTSIDLEGYAKQVIVSVAENKTVNGYQVPKLTDEDLATIYNAVVAGDSVVIVDATETMFFTDVNADSVSGDLFISFRYFTLMILEYGEGNVTNYTEIGGGGQGDLNIKNGSGLNALRQTTDNSEENKAVTKGSVTMGFGNITGQKCWYYSEYASNSPFGGTVFDLVLKLTQTQTTPIEKSIIEDSGSGNSGFSVGDIVYVMNDDLYVDYEVKFVQNMVVCLNHTNRSIIGLKIPSDPQRWDYTIFCPAKPDVGAVDFGECAFSTGHLNQVIGSYAFAEGEKNTAIGNYSHVEGRRNIAFGNRAHAEGYDTKAIGKNAHAEGTNTVAQGYNSHAEGDMTSAIAVDAHAEGYLTEATSNQAHAEGRDTRATGIASHAEGYHTRASGNYSHAEGKGEGDEGFNLASGNFSHVEGNGTTASNNSAHAEGLGTIASGMHSHAEGNYTQAIGVDSHAEGVFSQATGVGSHAEGYKDVADSTDLGTRATNRGAHAEGRRTLASGVDAHAEGDLTEATGSDSHAEGYKCKATLNQAHAEGRETLAKGWASHAEGEGTIAKDRASHAAGKFNIETSGARVTGNGSDANIRRNIEVLDWQGNIKVAGSLTFDMNGTPVTITAQQLSQLLNLL